MKAEAGAEMITTVYIIRGVQESLLGLRDGQTLGILKIILEGNLARMSTDPPPGAETRGRQTQEQLDQSMEDMMKLLQKALSELREESLSGRHTVTRPMEEWLSS